MDDTQIKSLKFHVDTGDYFRVLGTVFGFLEETVESSCKAVPDELMSMQKDVIVKFRTQLEHLHAHYEIIPKQ